MIVGNELFAACHVEKADVGIYMMVLCIFSAAFAWASLMVSVSTLCIGGFVEL